MRQFFTFSSLLVLFALVLAACGSPTAPAPEQPAASDEPFIFGMLHVGPYNDRGWSQAHHEGGEYVVKNVPAPR
jgi:simple sugar transport system substrate-binding protein